MRRLFAIAAALLFVSLSVSQAKAEVTAAQAARALSGIENPVTAPRMQALGTGWEKAMIALLHDPATRAIVRPRAIAALGFSKDASAAVALREILAAKGVATEGLPVIETREAVKSLAAVDGARALPDVRRFLDHGALDVRAQAARSLGDIGSAADVAALRARLAKESEPLVRQEITRAVGRLGDK